MRGSEHKVDKNVSFFMWLGFWVRKSRKRKLRFFDYRNDAFNQTISKNEMKCRYVISFNSSHEHLMNDLLAQAAI